MLSEHLGRVSAGEDLSMSEMADVIGEIMNGQCGEEQIALLLTALRAKGESAEEVAGAAQAMREHMTRINLSGDNFVDTCGTGGDGSGTFNISTAAAIVTAAAGVPVAKHGNRRMSSKTGSADVLAELGVNVEADLGSVERCFEEVGICFCFAPQLHPAMKHVVPVRKRLGVPTIFNLLGPLSNPASAPFQLLGVGRPEIRGLLASALAKLGIRRAAVVCGEDGLDEVTISAPTAVSLVEDGHIKELTWTPNDFGYQAGGLESMLAEDPAQSAAIIRQVLKGQSGPSRDIVVINAAAAIWLTKQDQSLAESAGAAADAIDSGAADGLLTRLAEVSNA